MQVGLRVGNNTTLFKYSKLDVQGEVLSRNLNINM